MPMFQQRRDDVKRGGLQMPMFQQRRDAVKARLQLSAVALAAAHGDAQRLHVQAAAGLLLMASEVGARADARIAGVE